MSGTSGCDVIYELSPVEGEQRIVKARFSRFMNTELDLMLRTPSITNIVVCSVQYLNCIRATVFDGVSLGYQMALITDATGAQSEEVAKPNIYDISNMDASCLSTENFLELKEKDPD